MKFEIKHSKNNDFDIYKLELDEQQKPKCWRCWKTLGAVAIISSLMTSAAFAYYYKPSSGRLEVDIETHRTISVDLRDANEQERNRESSDGTPTTSD